GVNSVERIRLNAQAQVVLLRSLQQIRQCTSQRELMSSRNLSRPPSPNRYWPNEVGLRRRPRERDSSSKIFAAKAQCRMARTMFLPTPNRTIASSWENTDGSSVAASKAFLSQ